MIRAAGVFFPSQPPVSPKGSLSLLNSNAIRADRAVQAVLVLHTPPREPQGGLVVECVAPRLRDQRQQSASKSTGVVEDEKRMTEDDLLHHLKRIHTKPWSQVFSARAEPSPCGSLWTHRGWSAPRPGSMPPFLATSDAGGGLRGDWRLTAN
ncbi:hypothetical protein FQA47_011020 [Oryzias melastigma]|uniref:Uncharacterized protein n=1 Tax=Oryzias melastigma TaxID=30732 RepID=A0A834C181_ORYME|nr:hypothetical protein FQA47_011020 [Oryzias melastigma]